MIKITFKLLISLISILLILLVYLSIIGVTTDKFNSKIATQIQQIDPNLNLKLNSVIVKLDPFNFGINAKTIGTDLVYRNKVINIETIESKISIKSFLNDKFSLTEIFISTKPLVIKDLVTFLRLLNNDPKFFIAEKVINKGYVIADLKLEFDESGKIKKTYQINGLVKDGKINLFEEYNFKKIDFIFKINQNALKFNDIKIIQDNNNILIPELVANKQNNVFKISGNLITQDTNLKRKQINRFINNYFNELDINEILFSSKNYFKFELNENFKILNLEIKSNINLDSIKLRNSYELKKIFPEIKKNLFFKNQKIDIKYKKNNTTISGIGDVILQNEIDKIEYEIYKNKDEIKFYTKLNILKNPFKIDILNFIKKKDSELELIFSGKNTIKKNLVFNEISLKEKNNIISIKNLTFSNNNKIDDLGNIKIKYSDKDDLKNNLEFIKKNRNYLVSGSSFNIKNIIDKLLNTKNNKKLNIFNKNFKVFFDVKNVYLNKENTLNDLKGFLSLNKNEISELNLEANFSNQKNIKFTIKDKGNEKITTLYSYKAKPFVDRYKFIKGFEEGDLDFYSIKKGDIKNSTLKIDNFKIQEIPVLAKLLTLASLQGIADLLTGEGIRFTDFEMKFSNQNELMTIQELYAIGPAISILMEGYIQKKKLISLRGTLVPATTINRTISSIPLIGDILVGKKVGEGVFGVSFKIKGPPDNLETTVNPIKTLTPRFITRTLEKIKKN